MTITSFYFLLFIVIGAAIYYAIPRKLQWMWLLVLSLVFYYLAAVPYTIIYLVAVTAVAYISSRLSEKYGAYSKGPASVFLTIAIIFTILLWFVIKGNGLWGPPIIRLMGDGVSLPTFTAALGMGYYTLQIVGYIVDCYWGNVEVQKNPLKLFLFVCYFPQLTSGPISRYADLSSIYEGRQIDYKNITFGAQRILWGFVKKLVLAERVGIIANGIIGNPDTFHGVYTWIALLLQPIELYADFSGCVDIVLGVSEIFGIVLPENFRNPFFSRTSQEFWQRWHITLGGWAKDYVMYPLLQTTAMVKLGKALRKRFGKPAGKAIHSSIGTLALWLVMGIWHGGYRHLVGVSMWYWIILMIGKFTEEPFKKLTSKLHMKTESAGWHVFQSVRTYLIYAAGLSFFFCGISDGFRLLYDAGRVIFEKGYANPWVLYDQSILSLGITFTDLNIILICVLLLLVVALLREKYGYARNIIAEQPFAIRWIIWILLILLVVVYGKYGADYDAAVFIYQGF